MMHYDIQELPDGFVVAFRQEIRPDDSQALKEEIRSRPQTKRVAVDITAITLITTPGLGALVALHKYCRENRQRLVLFGLSPYVREIFDLTRLSTVFEVAANRAEALA